MKTYNYAIVCSVGMDWSTDVQFTVCVCNTEEEAKDELRYMADHCKEVGRWCSFDEVNSEICIRLDGIGTTQVYEIVKMAC